MGDFRIEIHAVGSHGCQRDVKDGQEVHGCKNMHCPDCLAREFVALLQSRGVSVKSAVLRHWPDSDGEVKDDLVTKIRSGNF